MIIGIFVLNNIHRNSLISYRQSRSNESNRNRNRVNDIRDIHSHIHDNKLRSYDFRKGRHINGSIFIVSYASDCTNFWFVDHNLFRGQTWSKNVKSHFVNGIRMWTFYNSNFLLLNFKWIRFISICMDPCSMFIVCGFHIIFRNHTVGSCL